MPHACGVVSNCCCEVSLTWGLIFEPGVLGAPNEACLRELLREMSLEHLKRAMQAPGFVARCFGEPYLKIRNGRLNRRQDCDCITWMSSQVGKFRRCR